MKKKKKHKTEKRKNEKNKKKERRSFDEKSGSVKKRHKVWKSETLKMKRTRMADTSESKEEKPVEKNPK